MKISEKLIELRKTNNLSQEDLADKLEISRQAISKWECEEALPDTENLIKLSKIYNISIDELLGIQKQKGEIKEEKEIKSIDEKDDDEDDEKSVTKLGTIKSIILGLSSLVIILIFLLIGFLIPKAWGIAWIIFLFIPLIGSIIEMIEHRSVSKFAYPIFVTAVYLFLGMAGTLDIIPNFNGWHPYWILFITIPVYYICAEEIDKNIHRHDKNK